MHAPPSAPSSLRPSSLPCSSPPSLPAAVVPTPPPRRPGTASQAEEAALADWQSALEDELGTGTFDFAALRQAAAADCVRTDAGDWTVELALSGDLATSTLARIGLEHACADVVPAFDEAVATVEQAADPASAS